MKTAIALGVALLGLTAYAHADTPPEFSAKSVDRINLSGGQAAFVTVLRDRETGCEYIAYDGRDHGATIVPRLSGHNAGGYAGQLCR